MVLSTLIGVRRSMRMRDKKSILLALLARVNEGTTSIIPTVGYEDKGSSSDEFRHAARLGPRLRPRLEATETLEYALSDCRIRHGMSTRSTSIWM